MIKLAKNMYKAFVMDATYNKKTGEEYKEDLETRVNKSVFTKKINKLTDDEVTVFYNLIMSKTSTLRGILTSYFKAMKKDLPKYIVIEEMKKRNLIDID